MRAEFAAFKARMEASTVLAGKVVPVARRDKDGLVRANYVVARTSAPDTIDAYRLTVVNTFASDRRFTWDVRAVAVDPDGLNVLTEAVLGQLVGHRLMVSGRECSPIVLVPNVEGDDGYDSSADLFFRGMSLRFWSRRN